MIVSMKKVTVITQGKDAGRALERLRSLGMLHVEHQQPPKGKDINLIQDELSILDTAMNILSESCFKDEANTADDKLISDWKTLAAHIIDSRKRLDQLEEYSQNLIGKIKQLEAWGDFDPEEIRKLSSKGIYVKLYQIPKNELKKIPGGITIKKIFEKKNIAGCVFISRNKIEAPFQEVVLPKAGLKDMQARIRQDTLAMEALRNEIKKYSSRREAFMHTRKALIKELEYHEALRGMGETGGLSYVSGYAPADTITMLIAAAKQERWGVFVREPSGEDNVPTFIRNPKWISIINPVFKLIEVVPGYRELDISLIFLVFFSVFFGMLIGDAGSGLIFFILTAIAQNRFAKKIKNHSIFTLFYILSFSAILWGFMTGTFFGQEWLGHYIKPFFPAFRNDKNIQAICFTLGATHLSIAHIWRAILKSPSLTAFSDVGWVFILWGGFFLARTLILGELFPAFGNWFFGIGIMLVVLFTSPKKNILKGIGSGLGALLLNLVNSFTDIVSYIRLFAVGLASVAIADSFNNMAMDIGFNGVLTGIATALILILGHGLNILLGPMSVLVHGVRLNVLEFSNHMDIKWSGFAYNPLRDDKEGLYGHGTNSAI